MRKLRLIAKRIIPMFPANFAYWSMVTFGMAYALDGQAFTADIASTFVIAIVAHSLVVWGSWFWNDIFDEETDKHSNATRTTASGDITNQESVVLTVVFYGGGLLVSLLLGWYGIVSLFGVVLVSALYSPPPIRLKSNAFTCMLDIGLLSGTSFLFGTAIVMDSPTISTLGLAAAIVLIMMVIVSYKDLKDAEHDEKSDAENFVLRYGQDTMRRVVMITTPTVYFAGALYFKIFELIPVSIAMSIIYIYIIYNRTDKYRRLVFELDILNGIYILALSIVYYLK